MLQKPAKIKEKIACFFEKLYSKDDFVRPTLDGIDFPVIQDDLKSRLERDFEEEEIGTALSKCVGDKAPGPDGFNFTFIKSARDVPKEDFGHMLSEFHSRGKLNKEINATFICLIPKVPHPAALQDFRPISLVGCIYKLLSDFG